jgi:hypothetical protein
MAKSKLEAINNVSNEGRETIESGIPYVVRTKIVGVSAILFHKYDPDSVAAKNAAAKGSKAKKSDNVESYVYRNDSGYLCLPGEYLRMSILIASKFRQDPRSPRKSAFDLFKAGVVSITDIASLGVKDWDYLDRRRVILQRNAVTRERPAMKAGWSATIEMQVLLPEYITPDILSDVETNAGRLVGVGDFRPTFGRFRVESFEVLDLAKAAE